jgi:hypothetical protein
MTHETRNTLIHHLENRGFDGLDPKEVLLALEERQYPLTHSTDEKLVRVFGNSIAMQLPVSNEAMVAVRLIRKELPDTLSQVRSQSYAQGVKNSDDLLDDMWGLICNVNGGIVEKEKPEWYEAFIRIRTKYFNHLDSSAHPKDK